MFSFFDQAVLGVYETLAVVGDAQNLIPIQRETELQGNGSPFNSTMTSVEMTSPGVRQYSLFILDYKEPDCEAIQNPSTSDRWRKIGPPISRVFCPITADAPGSLCI